LAGLLQQKCECHVFEINLHVPELTLFLLLTTEQFYLYIIIAMITEEEKNEMIEWVSALTDPPTFHHITILKNSSGEKPICMDGLPFDERNSIYRDKGEDLKVAETGRILHLKKFRNPLKTNF